jgi:hypothetical protein
MNERDLLRAAGNPADAPLPIVILAGQSNAQGWMGDGWMLKKDPVDASTLFRWMICGRNPMLPGESQKSRGWGTLEPQNGIATADTSVTFTTMGGLEKADVSHLTNTGLEQHGERLAEALTKLWERESNQGFE